MAMNFFEHQERARRKSGLLVGYYFLAVAMIILLVYLVLVGLWSTTIKDVPDGRALSFADLWRADLFFWVAGVTTMIVVLGSWYKIHQLSRGGAAVAELLGGRALNPASTDPLERKIMNVVEEVAIAAGTQVPTVYLLDGEDSINAFAAGFNPGDAVVGLTRGAAVQLTRDELQGVIAHEFSHIFNGDMRLNIRLMGVLNGILIIAMMGYWVMRSTLRSGRTRSRRGGKGDITPLIALGGFLVMVVGYVGVFFGKLIKSAVSRQREFLADASAVQFTRNPDGIGGALAKIGGFKGDSALASPNAEEASHFFFSNGLSAAWFGLMATHPPLKERIRRIDPGLLNAGTRAKPVSPVGGGVERVASGAAGMAGLSGFTGTDRGAGRVVEQVGQLTADHLAYAGHLLESIPGPVRDRLRDVSGAQAVVAILLLDREHPEVRGKQIAMLKAQADPAVWREVEQQREAIGKLGPPYRLVLADLAMPALRRMGRDAFGRFSAWMAALVAADNLVDLFEYALQRMVRRHVSRELGLEKPPALSASGIQAYADSVTSLLSCLAVWGHRDDARARTAYQRGADQLPLEARRAAMMERSGCGLDALDAALGQLERASSRVKQAVLAACATVVISDQDVTTEEAEMLRAVADALDCPLPPLMVKPVA